MERLGTVRGNLQPNVGSKPSSFTCRLARWDMTCQNSQAQNRGPLKKTCWKTWMQIPWRKYHNYVQLQADVSLSSPAVTKVSCTTRDFRPLLRTIIGNQQFWRWRVWLKSSLFKTPDIYDFGMFTRWTCGTCPSVFCGGWDIPSLTVKILWFQAPKFSNTFFQSEFSK